MTKRLIEVERLNAGDELANALAYRGAGDAGWAALAAQYFAGFSGVEMILTAFLFQNLFVLGDAKTFGD